MRSPEPIVSVIIVNYNGKRYVNASVKSVFASKTKRIEVIVVDNGSTDGSVQYLKKHYEQCKGKFTVVALDRNYGPAKARNEGVRVATGKYLGFLDNDTVVEKKWANYAIKSFGRDAKLGVIQCKLLLAKDRRVIDYVGEYLGQNGFLVQIAKAGEIDKGQYDKPVEILAAKSAGMFIRRKTFDLIGGFDESYFIYVEETDLGWRSWLAGYRAIFVPQSIVYHEFGTSSVLLGQGKVSFNAKFHGTKNYLQTLFKNLDFKNLVKIYFIHMGLWLGLAVFNLFKGRIKEFVWIIMGIGWTFLHFFSMLKKRKAVQGHRRVSDSRLFDVWMKRVPFLYFVNKATTKHKIGNAESF
jgi:hypothetical protein